MLTHCPFPKLRVNLTKLRGWREIEETVRAVEGRGGTGGREKGRRRKRRRRRKRKGAEEEEEEEDEEEEKRGGGRRGVGR